MNSYIIPIIGKMNYYKRSFKCSKISEIVILFILRVIYINLHKANQFEESIFIMK